MDVLLLASFVLWLVIGLYALRKPQGPSRNDYLAVWIFFLIHILLLFINSTGWLVVP